MLALRFHSLINLYMPKLYNAQNAVVGGIRIWKSIRTYNVRDAYVSGVIPSFFEIGISVEINTQTAVLFF